MSALTPERVAEAARAWEWFPDDAIATRTPEWLLVRFPDHFPDPLVLSQVTPTEAAVDAGLAAAAEHGLSHVWCWTRLDSPPELDEIYLARGGVLDETLDVFGLDLGGELPRLAVPADVTVRWRLDLATARDVVRTSIAAFGGDEPPEKDLLARVAEAQDLLDEGHEGTAAAYLDGVAAGSAGISLVDGVARLWGGGVTPGARGRGVYRAMLDHRLRWAVERGATLALVKGRVETSGPTLRRAGFEAFGQERSYAVPL